MLRTVNTLLPLMSMGLALAAHADDCRLKTFGFFEWSGSTCEDTRARLSKSQCARDTWADGHKIVPSLRCEGTFWQVLYAGGVPSGSQACFDLRSSDNYCKRELNARLEPANCEAPVTVPTGLEKILEKASAADDAG